MRNRFSEKDIISKLFFLLGLTSTITLLRISTPIKVITGHNLVLYILCIILLLTKRQVFRLRNSLFYLYVLIIVTSAALIYLSPIGPEWTQVAVKNAINYVFFYSILFSYLQQESHFTVKGKYLKGLKTSIFLQLLWESLQVIFWYCFHIKLNAELFSSLRILDDINLSQSDMFGSYRFTGLSWQSSNLGMSLLLGYLLFKSKYMRLWCIVGLIVSTSRVGIVSLLFIFLYQNIFCKSRHKFIEKKIDVVAVVGIILVASCIIILNYNLLLGIFRSWEIIVIKLQNISWDLHYLYYLWIPEILPQMSVLRILFGYGLGCSGYAYSHFKNVYSTSAPWIPENDFCSTLFGVGVIGCLIQYVWYIKAMKRQEKNSLEFRILLIILLAGFMYAYNNSWVLVVAMFCMVGDLHTKHM